MRRDLFAQAGGARRDGLHLATQVIELALQHFDLFLLAKDRVIERLEQIVRIRQLDFELADSCVDAQVVS